MPGRPRILLVDDEKLLLRSMSRMLASQLEVVPALGGHEALEILEADSDFCAVVCDLMMPRMNGRALYKAIAEKHPHLSQRILFMSGGVFADSMNEFLESTGSRLLTKPVRRQTLLEALEPFLSDGAE